jgi:hypothetical protein
MEPKVGRHTGLFDLSDAIELLCGKRSETFPHERLIRLIQLRTWIWFPDNYEIVLDAARLAATIILNKSEFRTFPVQVLGVTLDRSITMEDLHILSQSKKYRDLFDAVIAPGRGWSAAVLYGLRPDAFNKQINDRASHGRMIAELINYRLRAMLNGRRGSEANISHAVFFNSRMDKEGHSARSTFKWWGVLKRSSAFIYLIEKHGYSMRAPNLEVDQFWFEAEKPIIDKTELQRFFSQYAFITETLEDSDLVTISAEPSRIRFKPFSDGEAAVIDAYDYDEMNHRMKAPPEDGDEEGDR